MKTYTISYPKDADTRDGPWSAPWPEPDTIRGQTNSTCRAVLSLKVGETTVIPEGEYIDVLGPAPITIIKRVS